MKICIPEVQRVFDTRNTKINVLVIENSPMLYKVLCDIQKQIDGEDGQAVLSNENKMLDMSKSAELHTELYKFDINQKILINKASALLEKISAEAEYYVRSAEIISLVDKLLTDLSYELLGDISFSKINISSLIKASGLEFNNDYETLSEKLIDYMEMVRYYDKDKLFIYYNLRSLICDKEADVFFDTCLRKNINIFCIESGCRTKLEKEDRYIIDEDLCEIIG